MKKAWMIGAALVAAMAVATSFAQQPAAAPGAPGTSAAPAAPAAAAPALSAHVQKDIERHRAMALAHDNAARCLAAGRPESECQQRLRDECKGLAIGKYCGMRHEH
jgi:hypothetical protein